MRIVRFISAGKTLYGRQVDDITAEVIEGNLFDSFQLTGRLARIEKLLAPIVPTDILCIGLNYAKHAERVGRAIPKNPMLFIKASNSLNNPGDPIPPRATATRSTTRPN
jgi:2-keto-4-pentenoate hydratase/2-oxohepta-3-ene-1,7-dioic acid hydratase in catechol pathway